MSMAGFLFGWVVGFAVFCFLAYGELFWSKS